MEKKERRGNISRRALIRIISFIACLTLVLGAGTIYSYHMAQKYRTELEYTYQRNLNDLCDYLTNINAALKKGLYAGTPVQMSQISAEICMDSTAAKNCLGRLPTDQNQLENTNRFLSQVGNYAVFLSRKSSYNEAITAEERENFRTLAKQCAAFCESVNQMRSTMEDNGSFMNDVRRSLFSSSESESLAAMNSGFLESEDGFSDLPSLIYDGPFSDHIMQQKPRLTENAPEITKDEAKKRLTELFGLKEERITDAGDETGNMPCYTFSCDNADYSLTKNGGYLVYYLRQVLVGEETISAEEAVAKAKDFISSLGFSEMKESYYASYNGICTINFSSLEGNVNFYTDLVKISVALDTGNIVSCDARGYIMNHHSRGTLTPQISPQQAQKSVSPVLKVTGQSLCVIPSSGLNEIFCYEFACKGDDGEDVLVYVNAMTGAEEQILILIHTTGGTLAL